MWVAGHHLAASMVMLGVSATAGVPADPPVRTGGEPAELTGDVIVKYHESDDSIFIDDAYLIRGVAGRLLLKRGRLYLEEGPEDFTNKELHVDASLELPDYQDNLEARLVPPTQAVAGALYIASISARRARADALGGV